MSDDPVDNRMIFDERDDSHPAATGRAHQRIHLIDFSYHLGPAFGRHIGDFCSIGLSKWEKKPEYTETVIRLFRL